MKQTIQLTDHPTDLKFLKQCVSLAKEAVEAGDQAFGSVLVNNNNEVLAQARNRANSEITTAHPEIELAQWSLKNLTEEERKNTTMYTSGEHCPMCAAAHGWAGIGTLVYLSSAKDLLKWHEESGAPEAPIHFIPVEEIVKNVILKRSVDTELRDQIKELHFSALKLSKE